jgi:hypothetical protein
MGKDIILKMGTYVTAVTNKSIAAGAVPGASLEKFVVNLLKSPTCCVKYVTLSKAVVTQSGSITTAVTLNQPAGDIVTVSATIGAGAASSFTFNNSFIKADSVILATVNDTTGSGVLAVQTDGIVAGSCTVTLGGVVANTGVVTIGFAIM